MKDRKTSPKSISKSIAKVAELGEKKSQAERRNLLSSFFVTLLIGMAYQEMISVVKESFRVEGITLETFFLIATFFFVSMRFFIGNQLHLLSDALIRLPGLVWLYDLMVIIAQCIALVLLGSFSSVEVNQTTAVGFLEFLIILYILDIAWIISQWALGKFLANWRRAFIPWAWAILNSTLVISMLILDAAFVELYSLAMLIWLFALNLIGFVVDVVLVDYFDAL